MKRVVTLFAAALMLSACAGVDENTARRTVGSAAIGSLSGLAIGAITGNAGRGAAIGAVTGATGGFLYDQIRKDRYRYRY